MTRCYTALLLLWLLLSYVFISLEAYSDLRPHHYTSALLKPFTGLPLPYTLSKHDNDILKKGKAVISRDVSGQDNEGNGKKKRRSGRAKIIQDVAAPPYICMEKILDFDNYTKMVSLLKKFDIYEQKTYTNGTAVTCAKYEAGILYLRLGYYLRQTYIPQYNTLTWTLDYSRDSDFGRLYVVMCDVVLHGNPANVIMSGKDDNVGHWQVMTHPTKQNWSRVLFSTEAILPDWLPTFALKFIENAALLESSGWLKKESEREYKKNPLRSPVKDFVDSPHLYGDEANGGAKYIPLVGPVGLEKSIVDLKGGHKNCDNKICLGEDKEVENCENSISKKKIPAMTTLLKKRKISKINIKHI